MRARRPPASLALATTTMLIVRNLDSIRDRDRRHADRRSRVTALAALLGLAVIWWGAAGFPWPLTTTDAMTRDQLARAPAALRADPEAFAADLSAATLRNPAATELAPHIENLVSYALDGDDAHRRRIAEYLYPGCKALGLEDAAARLLALLHRLDDRAEHVELAADTKQRARTRRTAKRASATRRIGNPMSIDEALLDNTNAVLMLY